MPSSLALRTVLRASNPGRRTFSGSKRLARVVKVYDGDTINVVTRLSARERHYEYPVRIAGIDAPEMRPLLSLPNRDLHKEAAVAARDRLAELIPVGSAVLIDYDGNEKFGRLLGTVHTLRRRHWWSCWEPDVNVADRLLQEGMVLEYSGAAKVEFSEEQLRHIVAGRSLPLSASEEG